MRRRSRLRYNSQQNKGAAQWLVTYSDMVTLLLCFFVLLMSFSTVSHDKFQAILLSLQDVFGIFERGKSVDPDEMFGGGSYLETQRFTDLAVSIREYVRRTQLEGRVRVGVDERGLTISFVDGVLFDLGKADLREDAKEILNSIVTMLLDIPNQICVEGHTDNLPINTERFPSNWELSTARASAVIRYFIENFDFDPMRLSAAGYGEYRPVASNDTPEGRSLNRRVDIVILRGSESNTHANTTTEAEEA